MVSVTVVPLVFLFYLFFAERGWQNELHEKNIQHEPSHLARFKVQRVHEVASYSTSMNFSKVTPLRHMIVFIVMRLDLLPFSVRYTYCQMSNTWPNQDYVKYEVSSAGPD